MPSVRTYLVDLKIESEENARRIKEVFLQAYGFGTAAAVGETQAVNGDVQAESSTLSKDEIAALAPMTVLECTGVESSIITSCFAVRRAGIVVVVGVGKEVMHELPFMHLNTFQVCVSHTCFPQFSSPASIEIVLISLGW